MPNTPFSLLGPFSFMINSSGRRIVVSPIPEEEGEHDKMHFW